MPVEFLGIAATNNGSGVAVTAGTVGAVENTGLAR
jgi:hypothetical protein